MLDKLKGIRADLVRRHGDRQNWDFPRLIKALKTWRIWRGQALIFQTKETLPTQRGCVYCEVSSHISVNCVTFVTVKDCRSLTFASNPSRIQAN